MYRKSEIEREREREKLCMYMCTDKKLEFKIIYASYIISWKN